MVEAVIILMLLVYQRLENISLCFQKEIISGSSSKSQTTTKKHLYLKIACWLLAFLMRTPAQPVRAHFSPSNTSQRNVLGFFSKPPQKNAQLAPALFFLHSTSPLTQVSITSLLIRCSSWPQVCKHLVSFTVCGSLHSPVCQPELQCHRPSEDDFCFNPPPPAAPHYL